MTESNIKDVTNTAGAANTANPPIRASWDQIELFLSKNLTKADAARTAKELATLEGDVIPVIIADDVIRIMSDGKAVLANPVVSFLDISPDAGTTPDSNADDAAADCGLDDAAIATVRDTVASVTNRPRPAAIVGVLFVSGSKPRFAVAVLDRMSSSYVGQSVLMEYKKLLRKAR